MTIEIIFGHDNIWGYDESTWKGIDQEASQSKLIEQCAAEFEKHGLDAELTISFDSNSTVESDWMDEDERAALEIANSVWERHEWYVEA